MARDESWFRHLDRATARDNFLEKEMLEGDVRRLEARTSFFEKLAVLATGVLTVAVSFLGLSVSNKPLHQAIADHQHGIETALVGILLGLVGCILHNYVVSLAVEKLYVQVEQAYYTANQFLGWMENTGSPWIIMDQQVAKKLADHERLAKVARLSKERRVVLAARIGIFAGLAVCFGYGLILYEIIAVIGTTVA